MVSIRPVDGQRVDEATTGPAVRHVSATDRVKLATILGGSEPQFMTPQIAENIDALNEPTSCRFLADTVETEVDILGRSLDILGAAELPGSGEEIQVAIENQYGTADPDHFGRLVGWYMPETGARMGVLVAEQFEPQLIRAVSEGSVVSPEHGLWLVEACGYQVGEAKLVTYQMRACSLPRSERLRRQKLFSRGGGGSSGNGASAADYRNAADLFDWIGSTGATWLADALPKSRTTAGFYRRIVETGTPVYIELFAGTDRISIGSSYTKSGLSPEQLVLLEAANKEVEVEVPPARRYLRGSWWDVRTDVGRNTPADQRSDSLGLEVEKAIDSIRESVDQHNRALVEAADLKVS